MLFVKAEMLKWCALLGLHPDFGRSNHFVASLLSFVGMHGANHWLASAMYKKCVLLSPLFFKHWLALPQVKLAVGLR